ncbi:MAG: RING finger protein [Candidatus Thorarchaeota archaeon]
MSSFEDVFFYLDLSKDILKKKEITKTIDYYITEKNKSNIQGHYGLLIFQQEGNPIFITDKKDSAIILNAIEENWKNRPKKESFFENGLFYIFSFIAESVRKKSKFNRIIVITDTPSDLSEDYTEALFGLVSKIKAFPTFIDIIRVSEGKERFFTDDVKLNMLASDTKGGIFYIHDKKEFLPLVKSLIKSKQLVSTFDMKPEKVKISKEDYFFYTHLAKELKINPSHEVGLKCSLCSQEICPVCLEVGDNLLICEECGTLFHNCCITNYTIQNNIGIPHIFRCPKCDILLQIEQDEIVKPYGKENESVHEYLEEENVISVLPNKLQDNVIAQGDMTIEGIIKADKNNRIIKNTQAIENSKIIRIGGFFGKVYTVKKEGNKLIYQKVDPNYNKIDNVNKSSLQSNESLYKNNQSINESQIWRPKASKDPQVRNKENYIFTICPECGKQLTHQNRGVTKCTYCGYKF